MKNKYKNTKNYDWSNSAFIIYIETISRSLGYIYCIKYNSAMKDNIYLMYNKKYIDIDIGMIICMYTVQGVP